MLNARHHWVNEGYISLIPGNDCKLKTGGQRRETWKAGEKWQTSPVTWQKKNKTKQKRRITAARGERHGVLTNFAHKFDLSHWGLSLDDIKLHLYLILHLLLLTPHPSCGRSEPILPHIIPPLLGLFAPLPLVNISSLLKESHKTQSLLSG